MKASFIAFAFAATVLCGCVSTSPAVSRISTGNAVRDYEQQSFPLTIAGKVNSLLLCRQSASYVVWVRGPIQFSPNGPDVLGGLQLQVWLLRTNGKSVPTEGKPSLMKMVQPELVSAPGPRYQDSMMYIFAAVPARDLEGVVVRAEGRLYCFKITGERWQR
jgi:hypothetical protein